ATNTSMRRPSSDGVANLPPSEHSRVGTLMKDPDLVPLAAWIMWEAFFDEPEPTDAHRKDDQRREPPEVKPPPLTRLQSVSPAHRSAPQALDLAQELGVAVEMNLASPRCVIP